MEVKGYELQCPSAGAAWGRKKTITRGRRRCIFAWGTGIADVVKVLAKYGANFNVRDNLGRGCLQLAYFCQGNNKVLYEWLRTNVKGIGRMTTARGRLPHERTTGAFSYEFRRKTGPAHKHRGYKPQDDNKGRVLHLWGKKRGKGPRRS